MTDEDEGKFCPECGCRLDRQERPPPHPAFDDVAHQIIGAERHNIGPRAWTILATLRARSPRFVGIGALDMLTNASTESNVRTHIMTLRRQLAGTPFQIEQRYGLGYRLIPFRQLTTHEWLQAMTAEKGRAA